MFKEKELCGSGNDGGGQFADKIRNATYGDKNKYQQLTEKVSNEIDKEEGEKSSPHLVFHLEIIVTIEEEAEHHGHLITNGIGYQLVHIVMTQQSEDSNINSSSNTADDSI